MRMQAQRRRLHGVRVELDTRTMRRGASRLLDVKDELNRQGTLLGQRTIPEMPGDVLAAVQSTLAPMGVQLKDHGARLASHSQDLRRRALLGDIANELRQHQPISQHQMNLLLMWAKDGTIWNVAGPKRAEMIGQVLARFFATHLDRSHLADLSKMIDAGQNHRHFGDFAAGLVNTLGGRYPVFVQSILESEGRPQLADDGQAQHIVGSLALLLAAASTSGKLTKDTTEHIAGNPDSVAVALLLTSRHAYSPGFVGAVARGQLVGTPNNRITAIVPWQRGTVNAATLIMAMVARDPHAAASFFGPAGRGSTNPVMSAVYGRPWSDGGTALGHAFSQAVDYDTSHGQGHNAAALTRTTIDQVLGPHPHDATAGRVRDFLGNSLADHYMGDLYQSADTFNNPHTPAVAVNGRHIELSHAKLENLLANLLERKSAAENLMNGVAAHQTNLAAHGVHHAGTGWAKQIGSFDGVLQSSYEDMKHHAQDVANARAQLITKLLDVPLGAVHLPAAGHLAADQIPDLIHKLLGPHGIPPAEAAQRFKENLQTQIDAAVASAHIAHGDVGSMHNELETLRHQMGKGNVERFTDSHGHLLPISKMNQTQLNTFNAWTQLPRVDHAMGDEIQKAHQAFDDRDKDS
jgi:hypothetical protein